MLCRGSTDARKSRQHYLVILTLHPNEKALRHVYELHGYIREKFTRFLTAAGFLEAWHRARFFLFVLGSTFKILQ